MNKLINKIKYNILYNKIDYPLLHITKEKDFNFYKSKDIIFEQRDIFPLNKIKLSNQKYNSVILEDINKLPLEILKNMSDNCTVFSFAKTNDNAIINDLSKYFKFIKTNEFSLNLEFIPENIKDFIKLNSSNHKLISLVTASNEANFNIDYSTSISVDYLQTYINRYFVERDLLIDSEKELKAIKKDFKLISKKENILVQKQKVIKSAIKNLLEESDKNKLVIKKNKNTIKSYKQYCESLNNNQKTSYSRYYLKEIKNIEKLINININFIINDLKINKELLSNKSKRESSSFLISLKTSQKDLETIKSLEKENHQIIRQNNELIKQNNLHVSEISNFKFDIKETIESKEELIVTIEELERQLNTLESQKDEYYNSVLEEFKKESDKKLKNLQMEKKKEEEEIINSKSLVKKLKEKNNKNLSLIDEKSVLIQKLNRKLEEVKNELNLKDELINKKNLIIRDKKNTINLLNDELENHKTTQASLKQELKENNNKINSSYYKELYDNIEEDYAKIKKKYQKLINTNQDYKNELEQYELKIQELVGYNERISKEIDIDIDLNEI